jgi:hypothetical protein
LGRLDLSEWISIRKDRSNRFMRPSRQASVAGNVKYLVSVSGQKEPDILNQTQVRPLLLEIAEAQEPKASKVRRDELADRIFDRLWNFNQIFCNRVTGEVET